jgi:tetratricopeptide (TPR) repeat protein
MVAGRRLLAVGTILSLAAVIACSQVWGETGADKDKEHRSSPLQQGDDAARLFADELKANRFADQPLVTYKTTKGDILFAAQLQPRLEAGPARPCDYLVLVDTSASKAKGPLATAQALARALVNALGDDDRLALWTINTRTHDLSGGFKASRDLKPALDKLAREVPLGAVNLKDGLAEALDNIPPRAGRQRAVVFLGDGQSVAGPLDAKDRAELCDRFVEKQVGFYAVPLGHRLDPLNLHGIVNATGGRVVRFEIKDPAKNKDLPEAKKDQQPEAKKEPPDLLDVLAKAWAKDVRQAVANPVLYPTEFKLPEGVIEAFPTRLPPLRSDVPTLMVGKLNPGARFEMTVSGKVADRDVRVPLSAKVPEPGPENFFLVNMVGQWREQKDQPALMQADRALAFAFDRDQMARAELLSKAEWAIEKDRLDAAFKLFKQALELDPDAKEARNGLDLVDALRTGHDKQGNPITKEKLRELIKPQKGDQVVRIGQGDEVNVRDGARPVRVVRLDADQLAQAEKKEMDQARRALAPPEGNPAADVEARIAVADQRLTQVVNDAIRTALRMVGHDPDGAHEFLKRTLDSVRGDPDVSNRVRLRLADRVERALQDVDTRGAAVKRDQALDLSAQAAAANRLDKAQENKLQEDRLRERMRVFHSLMDQAREEEAFNHALAIRRDLIDQGLPVPASVTAGYQTGLAGFHLREEQELRRLREERFLATMLQVEKSHVPFPDEPPVQFPTPALWRKLTDLRKARYESTTFGSEMPARAFELQKLLATPVHFEGLDDPKTTLLEALDALAKKYQVTFDVNEKAFKFENVMDVLKTEVAQPNPIPPMKTTLATVLRKILARVPVGSGATWLIRRDVIEITTGTFASAEKTVRVYPVADLVTPIPNSFNQQMIQQSATVFGMGLLGSPAYTLGGGIGGGLGFAGLGGLAGAAGLGGLGGVAGLAGLAGLGGNLAGLGGLGLAGAGVAGQGGGFNQLGVNGGFRGNFQGQANLGMGGVIGFGGQQLGQFGNLGGQFGLQGGNQSQILITLIRQVIGKPKDWAVNYDPVSGQPLNPLDDNSPEGLNQENNNLGYYPPALALVVKATSTMHSRASSLVINAAPQGALMGAAPREPGKVRVAGAGGEREDPNDPNKKDPNRRNFPGSPPLDPKVVWQEALVKAPADPGLVIATADYLALSGKWDHVAEFLKADLRQGIVVEPWVYKSLAIALRESGAPPEEIERAEVSCADLKPTDARGYLQGARALARDKNYARALAFCRQAALLEPNVPAAYSDAVGYAELARDARAMEWAAGRLLGQDWPVHNKELHDRATRKLKALAGLLMQEDRREQSERLLATLGGMERRDLVILLRWQGKADLDLKVAEPSGSVCSALNRQTIGGGTLIGDSLVDPNSETYVAAEAFSGTYTVTVERVWGKPSNDKAQLWIYRHKGTKDEKLEIVTVELKGSHLSAPIAVQLDGGRRTETAYVAPPSAAKEPPETRSGDGAERPDSILHKLAVMADPEVTSCDLQGLRGNVAAPGRPMLPSQVARGTPDPAADDRMVYQAKVAPFVANSIDVTAQAVISADRRTVRLSMTPVFNTVTGVQLTPVVSNPIIPGFRLPGH